MAKILDIDDYDLSEARAIVAAFGTDRFGYIVTPNVDHVIRHFYDAHFRDLYKNAAYVLLDSRFLANMVGLLKQQRLRVCAGSDLTAAVLHTVIKPSDTAVLVGGTPAQAEFLRARFKLKSLHQVEPPMNFISDEAAVERCLLDIEALSPFRFCFLAIGSPQQEIIAQRLKERGIARGLALCVGASINYMTGAEKRAPNWMRKSGFEWLYRLLGDPRRLAKRYLVRGPRIFSLLYRIELRPRRTAAAAGASFKKSPAVLTAAKTSISSQVVPMVGVARSGSTPAALGMGRNALAMKSKINHTSDAMSFEPTRASGHAK